jgi:hypothetical protein
MAKRVVILKILIASWAVIGILCPIPSAGVEWDFRGQVAAWVGSEKALSTWGTESGISYVPQLTLTRQAWDAAFADLEVSLKGYHLRRQRGPEDTTDLDVYRLKLRFATPRTESRVGLQQINFGPAYLLRSLRWFDRLDPRDPLGLTDGVYALTFRYVAQNNTTVWLWGLYGNEDPKGNEALPTLKEKPEAGGRLQIPLTAGEGAFSFHYRDVDGPEPLINDFAESRIALDGRWDIEIGTWYEAVLIHQDSNQLPYKWQKMITLGLDYTIPTGNGIHALLEHMAAASSEAVSGWVEDSHVSGLSLSYPIGYADRLSAIPFYYWDSRDYSLYASWEHYWDNLGLNVSLYRYPDGLPIEGVMTGMRRTADRGVKVLMTYNH